MPLIIRRLGEEQRQAAIAVTQLNVWQQESIYEPFSTWLGHATSLLVLELYAHEVQDETRAAARTNGSIFWSEGQI